VWASAETPSKIVSGHAGLLHLQGILQTHMKRSSDANFVASSATSRCSNYTIQFLIRARDSTKSLPVDIGVH
jgi:hypothetical protein